MIPELIELWLTRVSLRTIYRLYLTSSVVRKIIFKQSFWIELTRRRYGILPTFIPDYRLYYFRQSGLPVGGTLINLENPDFSFPGVVKFLPVLAPYQSIVGHLVILTTDGRLYSTQSIVKPDWVEIETAGRVLDISMIHSAGPASFKADPRIAYLTNYGRVFYHNLKKHQSTESYAQQITKMAYHRDDGIFFLLDKQGVLSDADGREIAKDVLDVRFSRVVDNIVYLFSGGREYLGEEYDIEEGKEWLSLLDGGGYLGDEEEGEELLSLLETPEIILLDGYDDAVYHYLNDHLHLKRNREISGFIYPEVIENVVYFQPPLTFGDAIEEDEVSAFFCIVLD